MLNNNLFLMFYKDTMMKDGVSEREICEKLGLEQKELVKMKYITGFAKVFKDYELKKEISYLDSVDELQFCFDENLSRMLNENVVIPTRTVAQQTSDDNKFKESLKRVDEDLHQKPVDYIQFVCSNCGRTVTIKK